jgi:hypothetical protein
MSGAVLFWILFWSLLIWGAWAILYGASMKPTPRK